MQMIKTRAAVAWGPGQPLSIEEVDLIQHKVNFADSTGVVKNYIVRENIPDENLGLITLWLGDYKQY